MSFSGGAVKRKLGIMDVGVFIAIYTYIICMVKFMCQYGYKLMHMVI